MTLPNVYSCREAIIIALDLSEQLKEYGSLSVVDVYDYMKRDNPNLDLSSLTHMDNTIGWNHDDADEICFRKVVGGVMIDLPEPHVLVFRV